MTKFCVSIVSIPDGITISPKKFKLKKIGKTKMKNILPCICYIQFFLMFKLRFALGLDSDEFVFALGLGLDELG